MRLSPKAVVAIVAIAAAACGNPDGGVGDGSSTTGADVAALVGCRPHIEIHNAAFWATELGRPEMWVQQNHRIVLWESPGDNRGRKTGELLVGSRAPILEERSGSFRVRSPLDHSVGWVSEIQVARRLNQNVETLEPC